MAGGREARGLGLVAGGSSPLACKYHAYLYALGDYYNNHMLFRRTNAYLHAQRAANSNRPLRGDVIRSFFTLSRCYG